MGYTKAQMKTTLREANGRLNWGIRKQACPIHRGKAHYVAYDLDCGGWLCKSSKVGNVTNIDGLIDNPITRKA